MTTTTPEVAIDLTLRCGVHGQLTFAGFGDVSGNDDDDDGLDIGTSVLAVAGESGLAALAIVVGINHAAMLIYLAVAWRELADRSEYPA